MKKLFKFFLIIIIYICLLIITCLGVLIVANHFGHINGFKLGNVTILNPVKQKTFDEIVANGLEIENEDIKSTEGKQDRFYYNQLSDVAKYIYDEIMNHREEITSGNVEIVLTSPDIDNMLLEDDGMEQLRHEYQNAVDSIRYDDVSLFYIDFTKMALQTTTYTRGDFKWFDVSLGVMEGNEDYINDAYEGRDIQKIINKVEKEKDKILKDVEGTDYQKIKQVHDYLVENLKYDESLDLEDNRNIYGALVNKISVCEGYAKATKYLLDELDIACILVSGTAINSTGQEENHMWNYVELDGTWYSLDTTWDDPIIVGGGILTEESKYKYFVQGDNIYDNHTIVYTITEEGKEYDYPELYHKEIEKDE